MDRMIYLAMSAAEQMMNGQALASHNLANANTVGFKADFEAARAMPVYGNGLPTRAYAMLERPGVSFAPGSIETTGNDLDVAVNGDGFIAVLAPDGSEAYSRAGDLQLSVNGQLMTGAGRPVLGNGGPIALPPAESVTIGVDGTISVRPVGQEASTLAQVDRIKLAPNLGEKTEFIFPQPLSAASTHPEWFSAMLPEFLQALADPEKARENWDESAQCCALIEELYR